MRGDYFRVLEYQNAVTQTLTRHGVSPSNLAGDGVDRALYELGCKVSLPAVAQAVCAIPFATPFICQGAPRDLIASASLSPDAQLRWEPNDLPSSTGFWVFDPPVSVRYAPEDTGLYLWALTWVVLFQHDPTLGDRSGLIVAGDSWRDQPIEAVLVGFATLSGRSQPRPGEMPMPTAVFPWGVGVAASAAGADNPKHPLSDESAAARRPGRCAIAYSAWRLLRERVLVRRTEAVDRPERRRLLRSGWMHVPEIEVVQLRAADYDRPADDGYYVQSGAVEWSCRWQVRPHTRRIVGKSGEVRFVQVKGHVKGPKDKPIRDRRRLYAVVR